MGEEQRRVASMGRKTWQPRWCGDEDVVNMGKR